MHRFSRAKQLSVCLGVWNGSRLYFPLFQILKSKDLQCGKVLLYCIYTKTIRWPLPMLGILLDKIGLGLAMETASWSERADAQTLACLPHVLKHTGNSPCFTPFMSSAGMRWDSLQEKTRESKRSDAALQRCWTSMVSCTRWVQGGLLYRGKPGQTWHLTVALEQFMAISLSPMPVQTASYPIQRPA